MKIYYASLTGNVRRFIKKTGLRATDIMDAPVASEPFVLVSYTFNFGKVPSDVERWLNDNARYIAGVASSGNRNWGDFYGKAGDIIAYKFNVPLLLKFEQAGSDADVAHFKERVIALENNLLRA